MRPHDAASERELMVAWQVAARGIRTQAVLQVLREVPREPFVPAEHRSRAYDDAPQPIGHDQTISQPYIVALMTESLDVGPQHRVLEIGTGSGYQTAVLARLVQWVYTVERIPELAATAAATWQSLGILNITPSVHDGSTGWPEHAPFDRILIAAASPQVPVDLLGEQLVDGGVAVLPVGEAPWQRLVRIERRGQSLDETKLCDCRFVPLIGKNAFPG